VTPGEGRHDRNTGCERNNRHEEMPKTGEMPEMAEMSVEIDAP